MSSRFPRVRSLLSAIVLATAVAPPIAAETPMDLAGFASNTVQLGAKDTGSVNVLSGDLTMSFPIGPSYPVNDALSYQLTLNYSSNLRRWKRGVDPHNTQYLRGRSPVGWGWSMHFGRIGRNPAYQSTPFNGAQWAYQAPDGTWHSLVAMNDLSQCRLEGNTGNTACFLTQDNTHIRAVQNSATSWTLWTPDGVEHVLDHHIASGWACNLGPQPEVGPACTLYDDFEGWYTTTIFDPSRSRSVTIEYDTANSRPNCMSKVWDSVRGSASDPVLSFTNQDVAETLGDKGGVPTAVQVKTADGTANYTFTYAWYDPPVRPCSVPLNPNVGGPQFNVLTSITLDTTPALVTNIGYMTQPLPGETDPYYVPNVLDLPDGLAYVEYQWDCIPYSEQFTSDCTGTCLCVNNEPSNVIGVLEKRVCREGAGCAGQCDQDNVDCWAFDRSHSYDRPEYWPCGPPNCSTCVAPKCSLPTNPHKVIVTQPGQPTSNPASPRERHQEIHWFTTGWIWNNGDCAATKYPNGLERRVDYYHGTVDQSNLLRTVKTDYEWDGAIGFIEPPNVRPYHTETTFLHAGGPSTYLDVLHRDWDLRGHYQITHEKTNEGKMAQRRTEQRYDHSTNVEDVEQWFMGRLTKREVWDCYNKSGEPGGPGLTPCADSSIRLQHLFDWDLNGGSSGFARLLHETRKASPSNCCGQPGMTLSDVHVYHGWSGHEETCTVTCGGDTELGCPAMSSGLPIECSTVELGKTASKYWVDHTYSSGAKSSRAFKGMGWKFEDRDRTPTGAVKRERDSISQYFREFSYDQADRMTRVDFQNDEEAAAILNWTSPTQLAWNRDGLASGIVNFDPYGRRREVRVQSPENGAHFVRDLDYDAWGKPRYESYWCEGGPCATGLWYLDYDPFGRVGRVSPLAPPDLSLVEIENTYDGLKTTQKTWIRGVFDPNQEVYTTFVRDGFGRLVQVDDNTAAGPRRTKYTYDVLDRLIAVCMGQSGACTQNRSFAYDGLGNLRVATEPESGMTRYETYDAIGNAVEITDAAGVTISRTYDDAGRLTEESTSGNVSGQVKRTQSFDAGAYPGRRTGSSYQNQDGSLVAETYAYGGLSGRLSDMGLSVSSYSFSQSRTYDRLGLVKDITYPGSPQDIAGPTGRTYTNTYLTGFLTHVTAGGIGPLVSYVNYDASAGMKKISFLGTDIYTTRTFDVRNRITQITGTSGASQVLDTGFHGYDRSGNIRDIGGDTFKYHFDGALGSATVSGASVAYYYDRYGNMMERVGLEPFGPLTHSPTTNRISSAGYSYSPTGNLLQGNGDREFDELNRLTYACCGASGVDSNAYAFYDADGNRVKLFGAHMGTRITVRGPDGALLSEFEPSCGGLVRKHDYVYANGEAVATVDKATTGCDNSVQWTFRMNDHLGTPRTIVRADGSVAETIKLGPFGEEGLGGFSGYQNKLFTGHDRDWTELDYMMARYYQRGIARFLSVDPGNDVNLPQPASWNKYTYVRNSPLNATDPTGAFTKGRHEQIIDAALPELTPEQRDIIKEASEDTDKDQSPEGSYKHSMRDGVNDQPAEEAATAADSFIVGKQTKAKIAQKAHSESGKTSFSTDALYAFGEALHTVTDGVAAGHAGYQPWFGVTSLRNLGGNLSHARADAFPSRATIETAIQRTRSLWDATFMGPSAP